MVEGGAILKRNTHGTLVLIAKHFFYLAYRDSSYSNCKSGCVSGDRLSASMLECVGV